MSKKKKGWFNLNPLRRFFRWSRDTMDMICDRPDHMQRINVVGYGLGSGAITLLLITLLVHYGEKSEALAMMVVPILGNGLYMSMGMMALGAVVLLGLIRGIGGLTIQTPGGFNVGVTTTPGATPDTIAPFDLPRMDREGDHRGDKMEGA